MTIDDRGFDGGAAGGAARLGGSPRAVSWLKAALACAVPALALLAAGPVHALYKVVGPDGKVTYTDTPPPPSTGTTVTRIGGPAAPAPGEVALPAELREPVQRFPVTLYTMKPCEPCDSARTLLRQRGVPFAEKLVVSSEDTEALARLTGGRDAPAVTIGGQVLRGFAAETWTSTLDLAGYPRGSRLPANWRYPAATPLTEAVLATPAAAPAASAPSRALPAAPPPGEGVVPAASNGIRF